MVDLETLELVIGTSTGLVIGLVAFSIFSFWQISRGAKCRWCPHCKREEDEEKERKRRVAHETYHRYTRTRAQDCSDGDCAGRR